MHSSRPTLHIVISVTSLQPTFYSPPHRQKKHHFLFPSSMYPVASLRSYTYNTVLYYYFLIRQVPLLPECELLQEVAPMSYFTLTLSTISDRKRGFNKYILEEGAMNEWPNIINESMHQEYYLAFWITEFRFSIIPMWKILISHIVKEKTIIFLAFLQISPIHLLSKPAEWQSISSHSSELFSLPRSRLSQNSLSVQDLGKVAR